MPAQGLAGEQADFDLRLIRLTAVLGRIVRRETAPDFAAEIQGGRERPLFWGVGPPKNLPAAPRVAPAVPLDQEYDAHIKVYVEQPRCPTNRRLFASVVHFRKNRHRATLTRTSCGARRQPLRCPGLSTHSGPATGRVADEPTQRLRRSQIAAARAHAATRRARSTGRKRRWSA